MASETAWRVTLYNDGVRHPNWDGDGPVSLRAMVLGEDEDDVRETVREWWREEHGWVVQSIRGPITRGPVMPLAHVPQDIG